MNTKKIDCRLSVQVLSTVGRQAFDNPTGVSKVLVELSDNELKLPGSQQLVLPAGSASVSLLGNISRPPYKKITRHGKYLEMLYFSQHLKGQNWQREGANFLQIVEKVVQVTNDVLE